MKKQTELAFYNAVRRPIGEDCLIKTKEEYKLYFNYIYSIRETIRKKQIKYKIAYYAHILFLIGITLGVFISAGVAIKALQNYEITLINDSKWLEFVYPAIAVLACIILWPIVEMKEFPKPKCYNIYDYIRDMDYLATQTTSLSELCALKRLKYLVSKNVIEPISIPNPYLRDVDERARIFEQNITSQEELLAYIMVADAKLVDECRGRGITKFYSLSKNIDFIFSDHRLVEKKYIEELNSRCKEELPEWINKKYH
ncbi:MAG: hypothetical protein IKB90_05810 [Alistipes sp.]|nr:hypothetical protein [Alistipes sp.]